MPKEMEPTGKPCRRCSDQMRRGPSDLPHGGLRMVSSRKTSNARGAWIESVYRCDDCGTQLGHSTSLTGTLHWSDITPRRNRRLSQIAASLWILESVTMIGECVC
jgi:hypothetical protein